MSPEKGEKKPPVEEPTLADIRRDYYEGRISLEERIAYEEQLKKRERNRQPKGK